MVRNPTPEQVAEAQRRLSVPQPPDDEDHIVSDTLTFLKSAIHADATGVGDGHMVEYTIRNAVKRAWRAALATAQAE